MTNTEFRRNLSNSVTTEPCWISKTPAGSFCKVVKEEWVGVKNSVVLVREWTIPTERPPPVGEVSANFCG